MKYKIRVIDSNTGYYFDQYETFPDCWSESEIIDSVMMNINVEVEQQ